MQCPQPEAEDDGVELLSPVADGRAEPVDRPSANLRPRLQLSATEKPRPVPPQDTALEAPPDTPFVLFFCAGKEAGKGTLAHFLRAAGLYTVMVDIKQGGYAHDATKRPVQDKLRELAALPQCVGVFSSVPCGSYSGLRYLAQVDGPGVERRWPGAERGVPRADGTLAPSVVTGNALLDLAMELSSLAISHGGFSAFESPVSHNSGSDFPWAGREDHAAMWDDPALKSHLEHGRYDKVCFDECCTRAHPTPKKTTQLAATPGLVGPLRRRFGKLMCRLPTEKHSSSVGPRDDKGQFPSEKLGRYSSRMNELLAGAIVEAVEAGLPQAGGPWGEQFAGVARSAGGEPSSVPVPTLADRELQIFNDAGYTLKLHEPDFFLGCNVSGDSPSSMNITMKAYVSQLATRFLPKPLAEYPKYKTPATRELYKSYERALRRETEPSAELLRRYGTKVGAMIYASPAARYDAAYAIGVCARCITFPTEEMEAHADRCIAYMAQHPDVGLTYDGGAPGASHLFGASDSDWCDAHSTTGWSLFYGNASIGYSSKRQHSIATSSTEAEINAASMAAAEIVYVRGLLREMGGDVSEPTVLLVDNLGAVALAKDRTSCKRSRHIERRFLKLREWVAQGEIRVQYVNTSDNPADLLTKSLEGEAFVQHVRKLGGRAAVTGAPVASGVVASVQDPLGDWESYVYSGSEWRADDSSGEVAVGACTQADFVRHDPSAALVRALGTVAGDSFYPSLYATPFGGDEQVMYGATPRRSEDDPTLQQAAACAEREEWQAACDDEYNNLVNHDAFEPVPEDSLESWCPRRQRASEVTDTLWVLKQKRGSRNEKTKKKGRICYNGAMQN